MQNASKFDFKEISVFTSEEYINIESINAGKYSPYFNTKTAYRYAHIELEINDKIFTIQPFDYVGEIPLKDGRYTYKITANDSDDRYGKLGIELYKED